MNIDDRMKMYEQVESSRRLMPRLPAIARIDGRCFSGFTQGLYRPYDYRLSSLMIDMTRFLVKETNANCGYTQSDEITLCWYTNEIGGSVFFDGRIMKMTSTLAALASSYFNIHMVDYLPPTHHRMVTFDCRVWNVPNLDEGVNCFLWREQDATKNSVSMTARCYYSHNELLNKNCSEMQEMLYQKGVNWNDYPTYFKRGTYVRRSKVERPFSFDEIQKLPKNHDAHTNPDLVVSRTEYNTWELPPLSKITNKVGVIFFGEKPLVQ